MDIWRYGPECELCHQGGQAVTESTNFKTSHEIPKIKHNSRYVCELCLQDDGFNTNDVGDWQIGPTCSICGSESMGVVRDPLDDEEDEIAFVIFTYDDQSNKFTMEWVDQDDEPI